MTQNTTQEKPEFNTKFRPQDDFFSYVNSKWLAAHPIPESETRWGTFNVLRQQSWEAMRALYEDLQKGDYSEGSIEQQARDFYYTGMHFDELEAANMKPVEQFFKRIDAVNNLKELSEVMGHLQSFDINGPWFTYVDSDHDDSTKHIFHIRQTGLTLPNRDYYLEDNTKMKEIRTAYEAFVGDVQPEFPALGEGTKLWQTLFTLENEIAKVSRSSADLRDVEKNYNKTTYAELKATYDNIDWDVYADALGWKADDKITVEQPEFMAFVNDALAEYPLEDWKTYLKWRVLMRTIGKLSNKFSDLQFSFFGKVLSGTTEIMPLWKRVVLVADHTIGEGTGRLYTERHFPESSKKQVLSLVENVRDAYAERIDTLDWMSDDTKKYAHKKLENMKVLIGYPDKWRDFSGLSIGRESHTANTLAAESYEVAYWLKRLHEPTSRDEWFMTPQTVNAYHDPNRLVICFPAGILQSPFFNPEATQAANMGGIGTVIGHELTHGFDDQGCMYDAEGNVRTWQTEEERKAFSEKAQIIIDQADNFEVLPGLNLKGKLVLGESIADLGGIELALHALKVKHGGTLSSEELKEFFTTYAFTECHQIREEKEREYALSDPHPASEFRVNGILQHVNAFYDAYELKEKDDLYRSPETRAKIW